MTQASGPVGMYGATIQMQPGRLEFVLQPEMASPTAGTMPAIRDIPAALGVLRKYADNMIAADGPRPIRIGLVLNLLKTMPDVASARDDFILNTGLSSIPAGAIDIQFAMNVPKRLDRLDFAMNRLCRWSVAKLQIFQFQVGNFSLPPTMRRPETLELSTLQIDLNTPPRDMPFDLGATSAILDEMIAESNAIASKGYDRLANHC